MSNDDTPPQKHRAPAPGESLVEWRLSALEAGQEAQSRKLDKILENQNNNMRAQEGAINRCGNWGREIEVMRDTELPALSSRVTSLESSGKHVASTERTVADAVAPGWGRMDWVSFFTGLGALITVLATLIHGAIK